MFLFSVQKNEEVGRPYPFQASTAQVSDMKRCPYAAVLWLSSKKSVLRNFDPLRVKISTLPPLCFLFCFTIDFICPLRVLWGVAPRDHKVDSLEDECAFLSSGVCVNFLIPK